MITFTSIVVPVDLSAQGDRALPLAGSLAAAAGIPIELVCVTSASAPGGADANELDRRAKALAPAACTWMLLHDDDVAKALVSFIARRPDALVVMATHGRGAIAEQILGSVSEAVLAATGHAVLLVGPQAVVSARPINPTLVAGVDGTAASESVLPVVGSWMRTFGGNAPWLVEVMEPSTGARPPAGDTIEAGYVKHLADQLQRRGIEAEWEVAHGRHAADELIDFADRLNDRLRNGTADPVLAVASERWTDPEHHHWLSVARTLTHRSRHPVLVVAAERVTA